MYYWLLIGIAILVLLPIFYFKRSSNWCIIMLYIAGVLAFFPMFYSIYRLGSIPVSIVFPAQLFTGGVEYKNFVEIINSFIGHTEPKRTIVMACCTLIYVLAPVFTIGFVFNYVRKSFDSLFVKSLFNKDVYIFSEFNDNSLLFAKSLKKNNDKCIVVFSKSEKHPEYKGFLFVDFSVERIFESLNKTNKIHIVFSDRNEDLALNRFFKFKENRGKKTVETYIYSTKREAEYIIDEIKKTEKDLKIQLVNVEQLLVLDTLWDYPLYMNMGNSKEFNISVFGIGNTGASFVKDCLWCTKLSGYSMKLNLIDKEDAVKNLVAKCPYINVADYRVNIYNEDVCTERLQNIIEDENILNSNYVFISLGDDSLNVDVAKRLRLYYRRLNKNPAIVTIIENDSKREILNKVFSDEQIMLTGNISQFYNFEYIKQNEMFRYGFEIYKTVEKQYGNNATMYDFNMQNQTEIYSSLSSAVHIKYKLFTLFDEKLDFDKEMLESKIKDNIEILSETEHIRWEAFERLRGYVGLDGNEDELLKFLDKGVERGKLHKDLDLKINLSITQYSELDKIDKILKERYNKKGSIKDINRYVIEKIPEIWFKEMI